MEKGYGKKEGKRNELMSGKGDAEGGFRKDRSNLRKSTTPFQSNLSPFLNDSKEKAISNLSLIKIVCPTRNQRVSPGFNSRIVPTTVHLSE